MSDHIGIFVGNAHNGLEKRANHYKTNGWITGPYTIAENILQALLPESLKNARVDIAGSFPCVNGVTERAIRGGSKSVHVNLRSVTTLEKNKAYDTLLVRARSLRRSLRTEGLDQSSTLHVRPKKIWKESDYS